MWVKINLKVERISIHAPARGATFSLNLSHYPIKYFNPRSRTGSDAGGEILPFSFGHFNPRSRTGSDQTDCGSYRPAIYFNPRSRTGSDVKKQLNESKVLFQSTLPHGERRNERGGSKAVGAISIHAPARGATTDRGGHWSAVRNFNPRSRTGSDVSTSPILVAYSISIHAPARGATIFKFQDPFFY